jgi:hypothetical protein
MFKKDNIYYAFLKLSVARKDKVVFSLRGPNGRICLSGKCFGLETSTEDVSKNPEQTLTFSTSQARQCLTINDQAIDVLKVKFKLPDDFIQDEPRFARRSVERTKGKHNLYTTCTPLYVQRGR